MKVQRSPALFAAIALGCTLLVGCSQQTRAVNDPKCVAFRKAASAYTNRVTKARYERRVAEGAAVDKAASSLEAVEVKRATEVWLKAKADLQRFYADDKSGCVSN